MDDSINHVFIVFITFLIVLFFFLGMITGQITQENKLIESYCQSTDYPKVIENNDATYCTDGETMQPIEWLNGK